MVVLVLSWKICWRPPAVSSLALSSFTSKHKFPCIPSSFSIISHHFPLPVLKRFASSLLCVRGLLAGTLESVVPIIAGTNAHTASDCRSNAVTRINWIVAQFRVLHWRLVATIVAQRKGILLRSQPRVDSCKRHDNCLCFR